MPVVFNEPLTFLQRMAEIMEYSNLLDAAASSNDPLERIQLVTAFVVASTSSNWDRLSKPFNPILGETYEMTREEDPKFRLICEQVSHHPPISAFHAEASGYSLDGSIYPKLRFWGKSIEAKPEGIWTLKLLNHQEVYTWKNVTVCVHNIIVGKLWLEQYGTLELMCHSNGLNVALNFKPSGWFSKELHKVEGFVYDRKKKKKKYLYGKWTTYLKSVDVEQYEAFLEANKGTFHPPDLPSSDQPTSNGDSIGGVVNDAAPVRLTWLGAVPMSFGENNLCAGRVLDYTWRWCVQYYNFTLFAIGLNELKDDMPSYLPRCDSRLRPDCRKLEEGDIVGAAEEKNRLEEKQREVRKLRKKNHEEWEPLWFRQGMNPHLGESETISRRLVANGLHSCRPLRRLPLTPPNRHQRLEWCQARSTWMTECHRVVFSDESRFCLSSDSRRVRVWRRHGERSNPAAIVERPSVRQRGIIVWGAIAYDSRSPLLRIQGTMTAQRYVDDVLRPVTLPYLQGVPNALYQQDNARPHTARISQQALQDVQMLPWPPYSPDLSPIEHVWDIIGRRLHALPQPRS
ncbi:OSBPL1A [Cordylochernes scorpioides]|uniref:Oxysterol-binding protein n=1 Tax=Cordylochernes scorpioides TaxID=51811 RepID=A0ABY6L9P7_9ARAC|nr:OSBPL1A [Cordylochernes scorpioides]